MAVLDQAEGGVLIQHLFAQVEAEVEAAQVREERLLAKGGEAVEEAEVVEVVADDDFPGVFAVEDAFGFGGDLFVEVQGGGVECVGCGGDGQAVEGVVERAVLEQVTVDF